MQILLIFVRICSWVSHNLFSLAVCSFFLDFYRCQRNCRLSITCIDSSICYVAISICSCFFISWELGFAFRFFISVHMFMWEMNYDQSSSLWVCLVIIKCTGLYGG